jgi:hypothetical protein
MSALCTRESPTKGNMEVKKKVTIDDLLSDLRLVAVLAMAILCASVLLK